MSKPKRQPEIVFDHDLSVGSMSAEHDGKFLKNCFLDTGYLSMLEDCSNDKCIILGRVGSGKSAILQELISRNKNCITIDPQQFSIRHITNSTEIQFFEKIGVRLNIFYQLLWRHVLCVELIRKRYNVRNEKDAGEFFSTMIRFTEGQKARQAAFEYFRTWGDTDFWETTENRVRKITKKVEDQISGGVKAKFPNLKFDIAAFHNESTETQDEIRHIAQSVVNEMRMQDLHEVIDVLAKNVFKDGTEPYYIVCDDLDTDWSRSPLKHRLIRALIESTRRMRKLRSVKIILSMRVDLLDKVFDETEDAGFQREKYGDVIARLTWTVSDLRRLIDQRIGKTFRDRYTKQGVTFADIFSNRVGGKDAFIYMTDRSLLRPRDIIAFTNECLRVASGKTEIRAQTITAAESTYSKQRVQSLLDEWRDIFPHLDLHIDFLRGKPQNFSIEKIDPDDANKHLCEYLAVGDSAYDDVIVQALATIEKPGGLSKIEDYLEFLSTLFSTLHRIGIIGIKIDPLSQWSWASTSSGEIEPKSIQLHTPLQIHPFAHLALGVKASRSSK